MEAVDTENISEELVIFHCSPTMAGLKTGSLFNCPVKNNRTFLENIREMNRRLLPRGVRIVPLKNMGKSVLVYMYRPDRLREESGRQQGTEDSGGAGLSRGGNREMHCGTGAPLRGRGSISA